MTPAENSSIPVPADSAESAVPGASESPPAANPAGLTVEQLARMLGVGAEKVREHLAAGAPVGPDGTVNLVHYAAWLNRRLKGDDGD